MIQYLLMVCREGNDYKYCYLTLIIIFNTIHLFALKSNGFKYCYVIPIILFSQTVKVFQEL